MKEKKNSKQQQQLPQELEGMEELVAEYASKPVQKSKAIEKELADLQNFSEEDDYEGSDDDLDKEADDDFGEEEDFDENEQDQEEEDSDVDYFGSEDEDEENEEDPMEVLRKLQAPVSDAEPETDDDDLNDDHSMGEESEDGKKQLFADDSQDEEEQAMQATGLRLSSYERQKQKMLTHARSLESENVQDKAWTLKGEVSARLRPENSLLEEDLEFDFQAVPPPSITTDVTESIEDIIRRRIKERLFDNPVAPVSEELKDQATQMREKRQKIALELQERTNLGDVYEKDFLRGKGEAALEDTLDPKLKSKYKELNDLYEKIAHTVDGLLFQSTNFALRTK